MAYQKQSRVESPLFRRIRPGFSVLLTSPFPVSGMSAPARPPRELPSAHRRQAWSTSPRPAGKTAAGAAPAPRRTQSPVPSTKASRQPLSPAIAGR